MDDTRYEYIDNALIIRDKYTSCSIDWNQGRPVAMEQLGAGKWKDGAPHQRILVPAHIKAGNSRKALDTFAGQVPDEVIDIVSPFKDYQWMMIRLLTCNPYSSELAHSNPVLAYCLANNDHFRKVYSSSVAWEQANMYSRRKQKLILQFLGFPSREIIVKLMKKIDCNEMSIGLLRLLRSALRENNPTIKLLSHYDNITAGMLGLTNSTLAKYVTSELLADVSSSENERFTSATADKLNEIRRMDKMLSNTLRTRPFKSIKAVNKFHENMALVYRVKLEKMRKRNIKKASMLGDPPIPGTKVIVPILTRSQLALESKDMSNCVKDYANKVKNGEVYIYKVLEPERATLSITQTFNGEWRISELKKKRNAAVWPSTTQTVQDWLNEQNGLKSS